MVKLDLKEGYCSVRIHPNSQDLLRIWWRDRPLNFAFLPFDLSSTHPDIYQALETGVAFLREREICLIIYIDNILLMADKKEKRATHLVLTLDVLEYLGFLITYEKSWVEPIQLNDHDDNVASREGPKGDQGSQSPTELPKDHCTPVGENGGNSKFLYACCNTS